MSLQWLSGFVGMALVYASACAALILLLAAFVGRFPGWRVLPLMLSTLFFAFLTLHPFPPPSTIACPVASATPQLTPFGYWPFVEEIWREGRGPMQWLGNKFILSTLMNFVLCAVIGVALARHVVRFGWVVLFAVALTVAVELTQLTGIWGIYPCAIRQFNVDDLMLNSLGVICGWLVARPFAGPVSRPAARRRRRWP